MRFCLGVLLASCLSLAALVEHAGRANEATAPVAGGPLISHQDPHFQLASKVLDIGWRLATANARFCNAPSLSVGLQLHDMASYSDPQAMRAILGLEGDIAVFSSARGSPAAEAQLTYGREIASINGVDPSSWPAEAKRDWKRAERVHDWIDRQLIEEGRLAIVLRSGESITLNPVAACASRFEVGGSGKVALADGKRIRLSMDYPAFSYPQDELAAVIAHELAHNLLGHPAWLEANGRKRKDVRLSEREADRLAPWLLANAGYPPEAALRFIKRWGPDHGSGIFRKRTHEGWDERAKHIAAEIPAVEQAMTEDGHANWQMRFRREISP